MLLSSFLALSLIPRLTSAQLVQRGTSTTSGPLLLPSGAPDHGLDLGHIGNTIGGASAGAVGAVLVALAFWMLRWSRRRHYLYHNKELVEIVPPLEYRKRNVDVETASVDSFEGLQFPVPAVLPLTSYETATAPMMHETHFGPPPSYSNSTKPPT